MTRISLKYFNFKFENNLLFLIYLMKKNGQNKKNNLKLKMIISKYWKK